jgi:CHAT domain-containing protein
VIDQANCTGLDGYLMGYKLAAMDLNRCRLITLSACETALGEIKSNQGVLGIQRALKIAGVRKMLITLWKIPDLETVEFMELFYQRILVGDTEETALQKTQSVMCKKYPVRVWGAFVLIE